MRTSVFKRGQKTFGEAAFDDGISIEEMAAIRGVPAIEEVAEIQKVAAIDEVTAIQEVAAIEEVTAIQKVAAVEEVAAIDEVTAIEDNPSISRVLPIIPITPATVEFYYFCLYSVATADVNFVFTINGRTVSVPAHKCLLAHQSAVFRQMFFGEMKDADDIITQVKMVDTTPEEFNEFAKCFYYEPTTITAINVRALTYLTHKYDVKMFEQECRSFLVEMVKANIVSIFWVLPMATLFNYFYIKERCKYSIRLNGRILMECLTYTNCRLETLKSVLSIRFEGRDEARVFEKCISWAKESCEEKELDPTSRENIRNQLGECLELIHFERMSPSQFLQCVGKHSYMFHSDEIGNIAQTVKGLEKEFATVVVPPVIKVRCINQRFIPTLYHMMGDVDTADIFFTFGNPPGTEENRIAAHKCILYAYSPIFKSELMTLRKSDTVHITDASFEEFSTFMKILYGHSKLLKHHKHLSNENIDKVLMLVKKYNCQRKLDRIEDDLMSIQNNENLFWLFELSRIHSLQFLYCLCINRIESGCGIDIFSSDAFLNLSPESFKTVFSRAFNKWDALTVCDAGIKWAEAFCARNDLTKSGENIRMTLGDSWQMMPFAGLKAVDFLRYRRDLGDIFSSAHIKMIIDKMAEVYETESDCESDTNMDESHADTNMDESHTDTNMDESDAAASDENDLWSDSSMMESDYESSLEDDTLSESELESIRL